MPGKVTPGDIQPYGSTLGQVIKSTGPTTAPVWGTGGGGSGTVESVGLVLPSGEFNVTVSPITVSGDLTAEWVDQVANKVFAGPTTGADDTPTFRSLVAADIPALSYVTSVALSAPAELTVGGSPITSAGTLSLAWASAAQHAVFAGPSGSSGTPSFRALIASDLPNIPISQTLLPKVGSVVDTLTGDDFFRHSWSTGMTDPDSSLGITLNGGAGTVDIAASDFVTREGTLQDSPLKVYRDAGTTGLALTANDVNYVYRNYNGGSPIWVASVLTSDFNGIDKVITWAVARNGTRMNVVSAQGMNVDFQRKVRRKNLEFTGYNYFGFWQSNLGLSTVTASNLNILVAAGKYFWFENAHTHAAFDTTVGGAADANNFIYFYNRTPPWTQVTGQKAINATQYDNAGTLTTLGANRWRSDWLFVVLDDAGSPYLAVVMGDAQYVTQAAALAAPQPTVPHQLDGIAVLLGQITLQKNDTTFGFRQAGGTVFTGTSASTVATALADATGQVDVSAATAPVAGQALIATDPTHATWQAVSPSFALTAGSIPFLDTGGTALTEDNANLFWDKTLKRLGVGTASPGGTAHFATSTANGQIFFQQAQAGADEFDLIFMSSRGTVASPTVVSANDPLGSIWWEGHSGAAGFAYTAAIKVIATGTIATTRVPSAMLFCTGTDAAPTVVTENMRLDSTGNLWLGAQVATFATSGIAGGWIGARGTVGTFESSSSRTDADAVEMGAWITADNLNSTDSATNRAIARIRVYRQGATANRRGGAMSFWTRPDNVAADLERMRITAFGSVGIGVTDPDYAGLYTSAKGLLTISSTAAQAASAVLAIQGTPTSDATGVLQAQIDFASTIISTAASRRLAIIASTLKGSTAGNRGGSLDFYTKADGGGVALNFHIDHLGNVVIGAQSALATNATDGFANLPSSAGAPTGVPTTFTGKVPTEVDTTNNKFMGYYGGAWHNLSPGGGGGTGAVIASGAFTASRGSPNSGDLFICTDSPCIERYNGSTWDRWYRGMPVTKAELPSWAWRNQGTATVSTILGGVEMAIAYSNNTNDKKIYEISAPGALPYTVTAAFEINAPNQAYMSAGLYLTDGTKVVSLTYPANIATTAATLAIENFATVTAAVAATPKSVADTTIANLGTGIMGNGVVWLRMTESVSSRKWYISSDGQRWILYFSEAHNAYLTATTIGWGGQCYSPTSTDVLYVRLVSWLVT